MVVQKAIEKDGVKGPPTQIRNMCFTINDYSEEDIQEMKMFGTEYCTYIVFGKEIAPQYRGATFARLCGISR